MRWLDHREQLPESLRGAIVDRNNASDGDMLIAYALVGAAAR